MSRCVTCDRTRLCWWHISVHCDDDIYAPSRLSHECYDGDRCRKRRVQRPRQRAYINLTAPLVAVEPTQSSGKDVIRPDVSGISNQPANQSMRASHIDIRNGKLVLKQKILSFEKMSETMQGPWML